VGGPGREAPALKLMPGRPAVTRGSSGKAARFIPVWAKGSWFAVESALF